MERGPPGLDLEVPIYAGLGEGPFMRGPRNHAGASQDLNHITATHHKHKQTVLHIQTHGAMSTHSPVAGLRRIMASDLAAGG